MTVIASWAELQANSRDIVAALERDEHLKLAAASNPLMALSELGYQIADEARAAILDKLRLPAATARRRADLREEIAALTGRAIDPDDTDDLGRLLFDELKLTPYPDERGCYPPRPSPEPPRKRLTAQPPADPLETLRGRHPVIEPLLKYRALGAEAWPFAPPEAYLAIRSGKTPTLLDRTRIRFKPRRGGRRKAGKDDGDG